MCDDYQGTAAKKRMTPVGRPRLTGGEEICHVDAILMVLLLGISGVEARLLWSNSGFVIRLLRPSF